VTLSQPKVLALLKEKFHCGWRNIKGDPGVGESHDHAPSNRAANVNNGAGFHNVQVFVLTPDGRVVHCLPGFWKPEILCKELEFGIELVKIWRDGSLPLREKVRRFTDAHLAHLQKHASKDVKESELPHFDQWHETSKGSKTDTTRANGQVKKADQIVHERMAERPFVPFKEFDTAVYSDVGQKFYDAHCDGCAANR
jgi:hypothetical protein